MSVSIPTTFVVFGATGDLMARKIAPALFRLFEQKQLPVGFRLIGFARRDWSNEVFRDHLRGILSGHVEGSAADVDAFVSLCTYVRGDFVHPDGYETLKESLAGQNALLYLSVPPESMPPILGQLARLQFGARGKTWTRVVVEKPIGTDGKSGRELDHELAAGFSEEQIYRIDHYLAKQGMQDILDLRFKDGRLESRWNKEHVSGIHIRLLEKLGVEMRGAFYDRLGTLRDVGQNHLLEMLACVAMEKPETLDEHGIRAQRVAFLRQLASPKPADAFRAQYEGYRAIVGVDPASETETYFRVTLSLSGPRWTGVPVTLEAGKAMPQDEKDVTITFKDGTSHTFDFHSRAKYVEEYQKLLLDVLHGDQTRFLNAAEVDALWKWADPIVATWKYNEAPLGSYKPGEVIESLSR